jgi:hypothetical protein
MGRIEMVDRHFNSDRIHVSRLKDGAYLIGMAGMLLSDVSRAEWAATNAKVLAGFDEADAHHADLHRMGVA